jgi:hypothetical protein
MLCVYIAHRQMTKRLQELSEQEDVLRGGAAS